ncbi:MAG: LysR family transcriptional regulator [Pseudomonadota bacterium]
MPPNHHQVRAFAYVVREGSFSAAAKSLSVSQSAVTQHVANLERRVGSKLLVRARQGVELTRTGRELFEFAERLVTLETLIEERIGGYSDLSHGQLSVIANAPQPALRLISTYGMRYPEIEVDFALHDWTSAMSLLRANHVDIGIITAPARSDDLYVHKMTEAKYVLYCRSDHPLAQKTDVKLEDLIHEVLLLPERGSLTQRVVTDCLQKHGIQPRRTQKTTTFPVMKEAILESVGVGIFLENSAADETRLVERAIIEMPQTFDTCLVVPKHKLELRLIQSFVQLEKDYAMANAAPSHGRAQTPR